MREMRPGRAMPGSVGHVYSVLASSTSCVENRTLRPGCFHCV